MGEQFFNCCPRQTPVYADKEYDSSENRDKVERTFGSIHWSFLGGVAQYVELAGLDFNM